MNRATFFDRPWMINIIVIVTLAAGLGIRLLDLTDLPLDFHPTRQLYSAIKARGMYYQFVTDVPEWQRQLAIQLWRDETAYEPPVMETIVAGTYLLAGEHLWIARIYSSVFWLLGGLALFALARRIASTDGALISLFYFVFLYFGIIASRSFQPDPLMVAMILTALWSFYKWNETNTWKWTILAGLLSGFAIFVKPMAAFPLFGGFALSILARRGLRSAWNDKHVWALGMIAALPITIYLIDGKYISGFFKIQSSLRFFPELWIDPAFYIRWYNMIGNTVGSGAFLLSLLGIFLVDRREDKPLLTGLWLGYIVYGLTFAYFIGTHNYYQLPLIPVVSLSLAIVARTLFDKINEINTRSLITYLVIGAIILVGIGNSMWDARVTLVRDDYRGEAKFWEGLGDKLGHTPGVVGLTHDYGHRLAYFGWQASVPWLGTGDMKVRELSGLDLDIDRKFADVLIDQRYFVVTLFNQFDSQSKVKDVLYDTYPIYAQGDGYVIFDLQHPKNP